MDAKRSLVSLVLTWIIMLIGLYFWFREMDAWAHHAFANPFMASALIGVLQVLGAVLALCLASPLSRLLEIFLGRQRTNAKKL